MQLRAMKPVLMEAESRQAGRMLQHNAALQPGDNGRSAMRLGVAHYKREEFREVSLRSAEI